MEVKIAADDKVVLKSPRKYEELWSVCRGG